MKYNVLLRRKGQFTPVASVLNIDIPDELTDEQKVRLGAKEVMKNFDVYLEPVEDEDGVK